MNKPAMTVYHDEKLYFYFWPSKLTAKKEEQYHNCNVNVFPRGLESIDPKKMDNSQIVLIHTIRASELSTMIIESIDKLIENVGVENPSLYVCSEGLSYDSKGDAALNLASYKGVLLNKIYEHYGDSLKRLWTYSPITLKATAGCATKELRGDKTAMIKSFCRQAPITPFREAIINGELIAKTNFIEGVDDLVDSYWALVTMVKKEKIKVSFI